MMKLKTPFLAAALLASLAPAAPAMSSEDAFSAAIDRINETASEVAAAQARRARERKADAAAPTCTPDQIDAAYAALPVCEASLRKAYGASVRDFKGALNKGFSPAGVSLVLLTPTDAFFYNGGLAALERCSLKDGALSKVKPDGPACRTLAAFQAEGFAYSACPARP